MTNLEFHIKSNDYFGTLATILSLIAQNNKLLKTEQKSLSKIIDDLIYLQENYIITKNGKIRKNN